MSIPADPIKLTPSMLTFLWDECPRCFWLQARGLHQPQMPFPSVFARYHDALGRYCLGRCPSELDATLPTGRFVGGEIWVKSQPITPVGCGASLYFHGRLDHLARFDDETWGVIDFKTVTLNPTHVRKYARQLHAYAWALERAAPDGLARTPVTRLGLFCLDPVQVTEYERDRRVLAELRPQWVEIPRNDEAFDRFLAKVLGVLTLPTPPAAATGCSCCTYWQRRRLLEKTFLNHA